tara:strand:+ start:993 stop:2213 length:1221 start_codon:yes stop_codon:yes gene_type:complete
MNNHFSLPEINDYDTKELCIEFYKSRSYNEQVLINKSLNYYLKNIKKEIDNKTDWDKFKKLTYGFEFISTKICSGEKQICCYEPISRAFFKLYEIIHNNKLIERKGIDPIKTFHLAEGPGGFIECVAYFRKNQEDKYYGITLIDKRDKNIPSWDKCSKVMKKYKNIQILTGPSKDGDLYNIDNLRYIYNNFRNSIDFITGDGGVDYSEDFNNQEQLTINLISSQVIYAIIMQKLKGNFILKIFDCFHENTINIIYLLGIFYEKVSISKPDTSRSANSEKYIICKNFRRVLKEKEVKYILENYHLFKTTNYIKCLVKGLPSYNYLLKLEEINSILGQQQLENINMTLNYIFSVKSQSYDYYIKRNKDKVYNIMKTSISKSVKWCIHHGFNYNNVKFRINNNISTNIK